MKLNMDVDLLEVVGTTAEGKELTCKIHELVYNEIEGIYYILNIPVLDVRVREKA